MSRFFFILFLALTLIASLPCVESLANEGDWVTDALRLSGESDQIAQKSIQHLKANVGLEAKLNRALFDNSPRTFLALDVISTLRLEKLLPDLIDASKNDESGFFYLAINPFIDSAHQENLQKLYEKRLTSSHTSPPAKMVLLDTLARLRYRIPRKNLKDLIEDQNAPDVRSAALYYLRSFLIRHNDPYESLLKELIPKNFNFVSLQPFAVQFRSLINEVSSHGISL